jgi:16S rRNA (cytosine1402-N4)-methyltransferase
MSEPAQPTPCHVAVMSEEIAEWVGGCHPRVVIDGTYGAGGHSRRLRELLGPRGQVIALDRDPAVLERVESEPEDEQISVFLVSYEHADRALAACGVEQADALVLDLGLSSDQLADPGRGFSFQQEGPLDLRFDPESGIPASEWLATNSERNIADTIYRYGEERYSRRIAREIVARARSQRPVQTVSQLAEVCRRCVPRSRNHSIDPATRTFQALRIAVNQELEILSRALRQAPQWLRPGGRLAVISFHSLEDRIVKQALRDDPRWQLLTKKPIRPREAEQRQNPRSRSAKLRVAERVD